MVHFPGFARARLWIHRAVRRFYPRGFPHSEIPGSKPACGSPRLIAACHVLLRLLLPRHPPCALSSLTTKFTRHTAASPRPSAFGCQLSAKPLHAAQNPVSLFPAHRAKALHSLAHQQAISGTHKIFTRLVICPIYSVVKYRPRRFAPAHLRLGRYEWQVSVFRKL